MIVTTNNFSDVLEALRQASTVVFDTETNGLRWMADHRMIGLSLYFPETDQNFYLPFRHGVGKLEVSYTNTNSPDTPLELMTWAGKTKRTIMTNNLIGVYVERNRNLYNNLPLEVMDELRKLWGKPDVLYIGHNIKFDLHVMEADGFPIPEQYADTMTSLHVLNTDWRRTKWSAPKWDKDAGRWKRDKAGNLISYKDYGNLQLKWQCARIGIEGATNGEEKLNEGMEQFRKTLAIFAYENFEGYKTRLGFSPKDTPTLKDLYEKYVTFPDNADKVMMWALPPADVAMYALLDTVLTWKLWNYCLSRIEAWGNEFTHWELQRVMQFAFEMERTGMLISVSKTETALAESLKREDELGKIIVRIANMTEFWSEDNPIKPNSPKDLKQFLTATDILKYSVQDFRGEGVEPFPEWFENRTKTRTYDDYTINSIEGTGEEHLEKIEDHFIVRLIRAYRKYSKSAHTYLEKWLTATFGEGDVRKIHTAFNSTGTATGRFSSSGKPEEGFAGNFQNIPSRGYQVKDCIVPPSDEWVIGGTDYGQLELRVGAYYAETLLAQEGVYTGKPYMTELFLSGEDLHGRTSESMNIRDIMWGKADAEEIVTRFLGYSQDDIEKSGRTIEGIVKREARQIAKTLNFLLAYSGSGGAVSYLLKVPRATGELLFTRWHETYPAFSIAAKHYKSLASTPRRIPNGGDMALYTQQHYSGLIRKYQNYPEHQWTKKGKETVFINPRAKAQKDAWNGLIQGDCGYICGISGYKAMKELQGADFRIFAQIHDALDWVCHRDSLWKVRRLEEIMVDWTNKPQLTVDTEAGINWQEQHEVIDMNLWIASRGYEGVK